MYETRTEKNCESYITLEIGLDLLEAANANGPVYAPTCSSCAKSFAPGQLAIATGLPANDFAPGHQVPPGPDGHSDFAPGIEKKVQTGPGP